MLQPTTLTWSYTPPTGLGFSPRAYAHGQRIRLNRALGDAALTQEIGMAGTAAATAGSIVAMLGPSLALAGPIGAAVAGLAAIAAGIASKFQGCGQTCIQATNIVNQVEPLLTQNVDHYLSQPIHYQSVQRAALLVFDQTWQAVLQACGQPALREAGQRCITDRQSGACHYKTSPSGWQRDASGGWQFIRAGANESGDTCWNWFVGYRSPIADDPTVVPDPPAGVTVNPDGTVTVNQTPAQALSSATGLPFPLLLGGSALLLVLFLMGGSK